MTTIERFIISRSEKHLLKYRNTAESVQTEFSSEYQSYLPQLEACYSAAMYWHGTGRYHYRRPNDSRFEKRGEGVVAGVLDTILEQKGLMSHQDLWIKEIEGRPLKTISIAPSRMHARLYAHIHLNEGVWLKYVFGGTRFWMSFFVVFGILDILSGWSREQRAFMTRMLLNGSFLHQGRIWASAVRDLDEFKILPFWRAYDLRSDIAGDYPVLFGIKKEAVSGNGVVQFLRRIEVRIVGTISLENLTHIEVPKEHLPSVKTLLSKYNVSLPVIPLEFGELYCSRVPLKNLSYV